MSNLAEKLDRLCCNSNGILSLMDLKETLERNGVDPRESGNVSRAFQLQAFKPEELVFREGDSAGRFFFIKSGQVLVSKKNLSGDDEPLSVLKGGQFFGEIGLLEQMERTATVKAITELEVFQIGREAFGRLLESSPAFSSLLSRFSRDRLLKHVSIFKELDEANLAKVRERLIEKSLAKDTVVFRQNDAPDALYVILKGQVRVSKVMPSGRDVTLAYLGRGDFFGEMGLIEAEPRSATVISVETTTLLALSKNDFQTLLKENPAISFGLLRVLSKRLRENNREMALMKGATFFKGMTIVARPDRCLSCKACEIACAVSKSRTHTLYEAVLEEPAPIKRIHVRKTLRGSEPVIRPEHCYHCRDAPCLASCKLGAIKRDVTSGTIIISEDKCKGCGLCSKSCPFNVITLVRAENKKRVALKCTYCAEHPAGPACVRACPTNALVISLGTI
ncbi:MAG: cyclic nucleotide-binding domain-containing protein [Candidatus Coatesbacteria bacterium]|nr:cyclic nucleotide-binding domain-containing protein [Candidatus Coatesbacteria bacterium]